MAQRSAKKTAGLIILVILLIAVYAHSACIDACNGRAYVEFAQIVEKTPADPNSREAVESIIATHKHKKALSSRQTRKVSAAVILGLIRGAIIGIVLGAETGIIEGMVTMGSLGGILCWAGERANSPGLLKI